MLLYLKILTLLWLVNFAPPFLSHFFEGKGNAPLDGGRLFKDGKPLLGPHKTWRGVSGAVVAGLLSALFLGIPWWVGLFAAILSMSGDLLSSFIKRRWSMPSGNVVPGFDQGFEGLFPFLIIGPYYSLNGWTILWLVLLFSIVAYVGSWFLKEILLARPFEAYPRQVRPSIRLREWKSCQIRSNPFHYLVNFEDAFYYHFFMKSIFRLLGIYEKGKQNALRLRKCDVTFSFGDLPGAFDGYRILFLSDLHLDGLDGLAEQLREIIKDMPADLCIIGGDLRMETYGPFDVALARFSSLIPSIRVKDGIYAILGNHDCTEMIQPLEETGIQFLVNDSVSIKKDEERIWIVGVDDPHYYKCHDLAMAFSGIPAEAFTIFVAHSNEVYREASEYSPRLYLCGHTHAGQIRVPLIGPIFTHSSAPREFCSGVWEYNEMTGYTTCGAGVSGIPVRFSCPGEVTLITLRKGEAPPAVMEERCRSERTMMRSARSPEEGS